MTIAAQRGLAAERYELGNGTSVIAKEARTIPAVTIVASIRAGSVHDTDELVGLSYLTARVLDRGTVRRSSADIAETLDARGVSISVSANRHVMSVSCTCLSEDFEEMLQLVAEVVTQPSFPADEIDTRRGEVLNSIRQDDDNPATRASQTMFAMLYPDGHPYGRPSKGTSATVGRISRSDIAGFHEQRFSPSTTSVIVVGDVSAPRAGESVERAFGSWRAAAGPDVVLASPPPVRLREERVVPMMNKAQADIAYGFTTIRRSDPAYYAYSIMNNALGQYGIGGRLGDSIRERQGMAYYVFSSFDANIIEGPLFVRAGVNPANVERTIASIDEEMTRLATEGLTEQELADCKEYLIGSIPRLLETNGAIATFLQTVEFFGLPLDHDVQVPALLGAVTLEDVNMAARTALDVRRAAIAIAGPYQR